MDSASRSIAGVPVPGVAGGVKAGDIRAGGGLWSECSLLWVRWKSDMDRDGGCACGERMGGKAGDACAGR